MKHPKQFDSPMLYRWNPDVQSWEYWNPGYWCKSLVDDKDHKFQSDYFIVSYDDTWCEPADFTFDYTS